MKQIIIFSFFSLFSSIIYAQNGCSVIEVAMYTEDYVSKIKNEDGEAMFNENISFEYDNPIYIDNGVMFILIFRATDKSGYIRQGAIIWSRDDSCKIVKKPDFLPIWEEYSSDIPANIENQNECSFYDAAMYTKNYVSKSKDANGILIFDENMAYRVNNQVFLDSGNMFILIFSATDINGTLRQGAIIWTYKEGCKIVKKPDFLPTSKSYPSELNKD